MTATERVPPYDDALEAKVLGVVTVWPMHVPSGNTETMLDAIVETGLASDDFYVPMHRRIWSAVLDLHQQGPMVDIHHIAARVGDDKAVAQVAASVEDSGYWHGVDWARLVMEHSRCRDLLPIAEALCEALWRGRLPDARTLIGELWAVAS